MNTLSTVLSYFVRYALPPILGGVIGLFTNWLALQMLFRPYKAVYIGKFRLPFTPGIIPKRKESIARAVGRAVAEDVITEKELAEVFSAPQIKTGFITAVDSFLYEGKTIGELTEGSDYTKTLSDVLSDKIVSAVLLADLESIIASCGASALKSRSGNPLLSFLLTDKFLSSVAEDVSAAIKKYLTQNGRDMVSPMLQKELAGYGKKRIGEVLEEGKVTRDRIEEILSSAYDKFTSEGLKKLLASADVASVIEKKINAMDAKQIAKLTFKVMKKEMQAVIYLGGLLGALIGAINIFV